MIKAILSLIIFIALASCYTDLYTSCTWNKHPENSPEIFYINLDSSERRRYNMEHHLTKVHLHYHRVSAITPSDIYIPEDVMNGWDTNNCVFQTSEKIPSRSNLFLNESSPYRLFSVIVEGLCGRKASMVELAVTLSHLRAIKQAIYSTSKNRYALIMEDDAHFLFNIDFKKLIASAPTDFGILQLLDSNYGRLQNHFSNYKNDHENLWLSWDSDYGAVAYIIDKVKIKSWIDEILHEKDGWIKLKIIVLDSNSTCYPKECCSMNDFAHDRPPCNICKSIHFCAIMADAFIYSMVKSYTSPLPFLTNGIGANVSSIHQNHVEYGHLPLYRLQRRIYNELMIGNIPLPSFLSPACPKRLDEVEVR